MYSVYTKVLTAATITMLCDKGEGLSITNSDICAAGEREKVR